MTEDVNRFSRCKVCPRVFDDKDKIFDGGTEKEYNVYYCKDCDKDNYLFNQKWGKCPMCLGEDVDDLTNLCKECADEVKSLLAERRAGEY